jgi:Kelch motif/Putative binding domain, N-terminal
MKTIRLVLSVFLAAPFLFACQKSRPESFIRVDRTPLSEGAAAQLDSFVVTANTGWTLSSNAAWVTPDVASGGSGSTKVHLTVAANSTQQPRSAQLTITSTDNTASPVTVSISQNSPTSPWIKVTDAQSGYQYLNTVNFVLNNAVYAGLGNNSGSANYEFIIFNPTTGLWTTGPSIPGNMSVRNDASYFVANNKVYVGFGSNNGAEMADWWEYDPAKTGNAAWRQVSSYPTAGSGGVAFSYNNVGYAGVPSKNGNLSKFDPAGNGGAGSWTTVVSGTFPKVSHASVFTVGNFVYIAGGSNGTANVSSVYRFDPSNNTVTSVASLPVAFKDAPSFSINGKGYVLVGGTTYQYDPTANAWTAVDNSNIAFSGVYNAVVLNGVVYAGLPNGTIYKFNY